MTHLSDCLEPSQNEELRAAVERGPALPETITPDDVIDKIVWRLHTEICLPLEWGQVSDPQEVVALGLKRWTDSEIHLALEGRQVDDAHYAQVRSAIMDAVVARAEELFSSWDWKTYPREFKEDKRNLRGPLDPYLPEHLRKGASR